MNTYVLIGLAVLVVLFVTKQVRAALNRISREEAHDLVANGALLLDVRTTDEFGRGHIQGARNVPLHDLGGKLSTLPKDRPIVVYCASGVRSSRAHSILKSSGYDARDLGPQSAW